MALTFLKTFAHPPVSVKNLIHAKLAGFEPPRPHFPLRASMLMSPRKGEFCPREHALLDVGAGTQKGDFVGTSLRITFDHGTDTERRIREKYLRHLAVGQWACGVCGYETPTHSHAPTHKCPKCNWLQWKYIEPRFEDKYTGISGGMDILLDVGRPKLRIVELKTMSPDEFKDLKAPLAEHKFRTALYLHLADKSSSWISSRVDTTEANILYASKAFGIKDTSLASAGIKDAAFSPFKEYIAKPDLNLIRTSLNRARVLKVWRDDKALGFPAGICTNGLTKRAQQCSTCASCWSGKFPSSLTWEEQGKPRHEGKKLVN